MSNNMTRILESTVTGEVNSHNLILELFNSKDTPLADMGRCSALLAEMFFRNKHLTVQAVLMDSVN